MCQSIQLFRSSFEKYQETCKLHKYLTCNAAILIYKQTILPVFVSAGCVVILIP